VWGAHVHSLFFPYTKSGSKTTPMHSSIYSSCRPVSWKQILVTYLLRRFLPRRDSFPTSQLYGKMLHSVQVVHGKLYEDRVRS
jgi:hypothetical protein